MRYENLLDSLGRTPLVRGNHMAEPSERLNGVL